MSPRIKDMTAIYKQLREKPETSNAGLRWTEKDNNNLMEMAMNNVSCEDIANHFHRTEGAIRARINHNILGMEDEEQNSLESLAEKYNVVLEDLLMYKKKQEAKTKHRGNKQLSPIKEDDKELLVEIRDLMRELVTALKK